MNANEPRPAATVPGTVTHSDISWTPEEGPAAWPDLERPNVARMYDYLLGGCHNFRADRMAVERLLAEVPQAELAAQAARGFLTAAVRFLLAAGVRQFLDIGAGLPTVGGVHEIAQRAGTEIRVVYVDVDPVVVMHSRAVIAGNRNARAVLADLRQPALILDDPAVRGLLDLSRPVAALLGGVLQFLSDEDDPAGVVAALRDRLAPGGYLAISHVVDDGCAGTRQAAEVFRPTGMPLVVRRHDQVGALFTGLDLVPPGLVRAGRWRPEEDSDPLHSLRLPVLVGVGRVPGRRARWRRAAVAARPPAPPDGTPAPGVQSQTAPREAEPTSRTYLASTPLR